MATMTGGIDAASDEMVAKMNVTRDFLRNRNVDKEKMDAVSPNVGDQAPDFDAELLSPEGMRIGARVTFSTLLDKPVGLMFGSYTCPIFRGQLKRYEEIHQAFKSKINFLCVYILEAHPEDGWRVPHNWDKDICIPTPKNMDERAAVAQLCVAEEGLTMPMALDTMDDVLLNLYAGSPERLYAIGAEGIITHKSSIGPFDDEDVESWHDALKALAG